MKEITIQDYLRTIYHLSEENKTEDVRSVDVQRYLELSKPSVSEMIKKLAKGNLIRAKPYGKVKLTKKGLSYSSNITRKHRIIEVFLKEILKIKAEKIHGEAHRLEHAFSDDSINSIFKMVHNKKNCPHGKKIPLRKRH